jgi:hypothetical protein
MLSGSHARGIHPASSTMAHYKGRLRVYLSDRGASCMYGMLRDFLAFSKRPPNRRLTALLVGSAAI